MVAPPLEDGADQVAFHESVVLESEDVAVNEVTIPGTVGTDTVALFELAVADPPEFAAVTRQRIGLK
jgi:hypothetical protein